MPYVNTRVYAIVVSEGHEHSVLGWTLEKWYFTVADFIGQRITRQRERELRERQAELLRDKTAKATMLNGMMSGVTFHEIVSHARRPAPVEESVDKTEAVVVASATSPFQKPRGSTKGARQAAASAPIKSNGASVEDARPAVQA